MLTDLSPLPESLVSFWLALFAPAPLEPIEFPPPEIGPEAPPWRSSVDDFAVFATPPWPPPYPPDPIDESCASSVSACRLAQPTRIAPAFVNGRAIGFKLFCIRPNSLYAKVGLKNGDVVVRINGLPITNPNEALAAYDKLRDAKTLRIELRRQGRPKRLTYRIPR